MKSGVRAAFTIVELLVVIGIIAVLAALIFPVFAKAKEAAKRSTCVSNLHQIGEAMLVYMNDSDDLFPNMVDASDRAYPAHWDQYPDFMEEIPDIPLVQDILQSYVKNREVFHCPSDTGTAVVEDHFPQPFAASPSDFATFGSSYLYRTQITVLRQTQTSLPSPAQIDILFDAGGHWHGAGGEALPDDDPAVFSDKLCQYRYNTLFGDMHVKNLSSAQLQEASWEVLYH